MSRRFFADFFLFGLASRFTLCQIVDFPDTRLRRAYKSRRPHTIGSIFHKYSERVFYELLRKNKLVESAAMFVVAFDGKLFDIPESAVGKYPAPRRPR